MSTREWTFGSVSPAEAGDFVEITFSDDLDSIENYVTLSTQFEFPQDYDIQVQTDIGEWYAQLKVSNATLSRTTLTIDAVAECKPVRLVLRFAADESNYVKLVRVAKIMLPRIVML